MNVLSLFINGLGNVKQNNTQQNKFSQSRGNYSKPHVQRLFIPLCGHNMYTHTCTYTDTHTELLDNISELCELFFPHSKVILLVSLERNIE